MALVIALTALILALFHVPWTEGWHWKHLVRDLGIVIGMNLLVAVVILITGTMCTESDSHPKNLLAIALSISPILGFSIAGVITPQHRLAHLAHVSLSVWLVNGLQLFLTPEAWKPWLLSFFMTFFAMWCGFGVSCLVKKPLPPSTVKTTEENRQPPS